MEDNKSGEDLDNDKIGTDFKHLFLELTLKRPRQNGKEDAEPEDRHVLRQSSVFAFSRYNTGGCQFSNPSGDPVPPNSLPKGYIPSVSLESEKTGPLHAAVGVERVASSKGSGGPDQSTPALMHNQLSQSSNNQDLGSSVVGPSGQDSFQCLSQSVMRQYQLQMHVGRLENPCRYIPAEQCHMIL